MSGMIVSLAHDVQAPRGWVLVGSNVEILFLGNRPVRFVTNYYRIP